MSHRRPSAPAARSGSAAPPRQRRRPTVWLGLLMLIAAGPTTAEMVLDRSILVFDADAAPRQDVEITNTGTETLYLDTETLVVTDAGTDAEQRTPVDDPDAAGVLVTPARMVVPPGGRQLVRVVLLDAPGATDRIRRINVTPVVPPQEARSSAVKVVVAYQLLVIVRPERPEPDLRWTRTGSTIRFENAGNSNVLLYNGRQCPSSADGEPAAEEDACVDLSVARRLYAGNAWTLELPLDAPVEFTATVGDTNSRRRFD